MTILRNKELLFSLMMLWMLLVFEMDTAVDAAVDVINGANDNINRNGMQQQQIQQQHQHIVDINVNNNNNNQQNSAGGEERYDDYDEDEEEDEEDYTILLEERFIINNALRFGIGDDRDYRNGGDRDLRAHNMFWRKNNNITKKKTRKGSSSSSSSHSSSSSSRSTKSSSSRSSSSSKKSCKSSKSTKSSDSCSHSSDDDIGVTSHFSNGIEGWRIFENGGLIEPEFLEVGGNPGGHIFGEDINLGEEWFFVAPKKFHGDFGENFGRLLFGFDLKVEFDELDPIDLDTNLFFTDINGKELSIHIFNAPVDDDWVRYKVLLDETTEWRVGREPNGILATEEEILFLLENLDGINIRGKWHTGQSRARLDNVRLEVF